MSTFEKAIPVILRQEGGYVDNPNDPGGATNYGVSLRYLQSIKDLNEKGFLFGDLDQDGDVDAFDIKLLTQEKAIQIYKTQWWDRFGYERINDQDTATKLFSFSVNMGAHQAHKIFQRSINRCGIEIIVDGIIGQKTIEAANILAPHYLLDAFRLEGVKFYLSIYEAKKSTRQSFIAGWIKRAIE